MAILAAARVTAWAARPKESGGMPSVCLMDPEEVMKIPFTCRSWTSC
jgi:hypothetical protein